MFEWDEMTERKIWLRVDSVARPRYMSGNRKGTCPPTIILAKRKSSCSFQVLQYYNCIIVTYDFAKLHSRFQ